MERAFSNEGLIVAPVDHCAVCGSDGVRVYEGIRDRIFEVPGTWNMARCANRRCGAHWLDPRPIESELPKLYERYYTHSKGQDARSSAPLPPEAGLLGRARRAIRKAYEATKYRGASSVATKIVAAGAYVSAARRAVIDFHHFYLPVRNGGRLLEVGFGSGRSLQRLAELGWLVEGIETDPVAVESARSKGLNVTLGSLEGVGFPDDRFDAIAMSHVIEHVSDPVALLAECRRILAPGGTLVSVTPNADSLGHRIFRSAWFPLEPPRHLHVFTPRAARMVARRARFRQVTSRTSVREGRTVFQRSRSIEETGRYTMAPTDTFAPPLWAPAVAAAEGVAVGLGADVGEEIILIARP